MMIVVVGVVDSRHTPVQTMMSCLRTRKICSPSTVLIR